MSKVSSRIADYVARLPLRADMLVLEIGCGPGVAAREIARRLDTGCVVAIDRSAKSIAAAVAGSTAELAAGRLEFRQVAIEAFELAAGEARFDLAFAMRVGALDGRHPELERAAMLRLKRALKPGGWLFIDDNPPIRGRDIAADP
jgi:SAM-dependent methyltransferase